jgi:hypothetical protein
METMRGATSPVYGNVEGCNITHQYMEKLRGAISQVYGNVEGCDITQHIETLTGAASPTSI